jgi:aminoglycoside 6-adenylyltransferase
MRSEAEIMELILSTAVADERVRAVILNGSRANPGIRPDKYSDFDVVYYVNDISSFINDHSWTNCFGEKLIQQLPDEMTFGIPAADIKTGCTFAYLMLFKDGSRIDLTLFPIEKLHPGYKPESLSVVWLDKDNLFPNIASASNADHLIRKPALKEFRDTCNEFWWVLTYAAKGLARGEITYVKEVTETIIRPMFMKIIEWHIGTETDFSVSFGKGGKYMSKYLPADIYGKILLTYSDAKPQNNQAAILIMAELFGSLASQSAAKLNYEYNIDEEISVMEYLKNVFNHSEL